MPTQLVSVAEARRILPVSKSLLYELVATGEIPAIRVGSTRSRGGRILIERAAIEEYIDRLRGERRVPPPAQLDVDTVLARVREGRSG